jgi:hypothetical protein
MTVLAAVPTGKIMGQVLKYSCKFYVWFAEGNRKVTGSDKSDIRHRYSEHYSLVSNDSDVRGMDAEKNVSGCGFGVLFRYT